MLLLWIKHWYISMILNRISNRWNGTLILWELWCYVFEHLLKSSCFSFLALLYDNDWLSGFWLQKNTWFSIWITLANPSPKWYLRGLVVPNYLLFLQQLKNTDVVNFISTNRRNKTYFTKRVESRNRCRRGKGTFAVIIVWRWGWYCD